jgi:uncharacterized protein YgbK (DUF1537 family)
MKSKRVHKQTLISRQAPEWPESLLPAIRNQILESKRTIVVLDDDPTGTQTVYNVPVLTDWSVDILEKELQLEPDIFYILTNSRSLPVQQAKELNIEIGRNLLKASERASRSFVIVSRSDSTLRGHYPGEVDALLSVLDNPVDGCIITPYFLEGGRLTINDIHWVEEGEWLIPANETPFSKDSYFGYQNAELKKWVEEKTGGRVISSNVFSITIDDIRRGGPEAVYEKLMRCENEAVCIVNSITLRDMEVFVHALLSAESQGKHFLYRTAASFAQIRAGLPTRNLLSAEDIINDRNNGGLIIAGSYVPKTSRQLETLIDKTSVFPIEAHVDALIKDGSQQKEIQRIVSSAEEKVLSGTDVVIYTSRNLVKGKNSEADLKIGQQVSMSLVEIVKGIQVKPRFLVAKGGITASDIATEALNIKRAIVMGQILPGVPVWKTGMESQFPGLAYIVFPGNVGGEDALVKIVEKLSDY